VGLTYVRGHEIFRADNDTRWEPGLRPRPDGVHRRRWSISPGFFVPFESTMQTETGCRQKGRKNAIYNHGDAVSTAG